MIPFGKLGQMAGEAYSAGRGAIDAGASALGKAYDNSVAMKNMGSAMRQGASDASDAFASQVKNALKARIIETEYAKLMGGKIPEGITHDKMYRELARTGFSARDLEAIVNEKLDSYFKIAKEGGRDAGLILGGAGAATLMSD